MADADDGSEFNKDACVDMEKGFKKSSGDDEESMREMPPFDDDNDMDCEPFVDEDGPSDDGTAAENEKVDAKKEPIRKKKTKASRTLSVRKSMRNRRAASHFISG